MTEEVAIVVVHHIIQAEWKNSFRKLLGKTMASQHQHIVEIMSVIATGRNPSRFPHAAGLYLPLAVGVGLGLVVIITGQGGPIGICIGIVGPKR